MTGVTTRHLQRPLCVVVLLTSVVAQADEPPVRDTSLPPARLAEARCPVTGDAVKGDFHVRLRGRRVYCATAAACHAFESDPYAYQDGLTKQWEMLRPLRWQLLCPVSGQPVRRDVYVTRTWDEVYFASKVARDRWQGAPKRFLPRLSETYTFQTACGTCSKQPKAEVSVETGSGKVYFCCPGCKAAFAGDKAAFLKDVVEARQANRLAWERAHGPRAPNSPQRP